MICPLCSSTKSQQIADKVWSIENGSVWRCTDCDLNFLHPIMSEAEEKEFYTKYNEHVVRRGVAPTNTPADLHDKCRPVALKRLSLTKTHFDSARTVLEIGTSTGAFLELLKDKESYGIEPTDNNREFCRQFCKEVFSDITDVPDSYFFDVICLFHTFEHIRNPISFLNECKKHLTGKSKIIVEVPSSCDPLLSIYNCVAYKEFYFQPMHPYVYSERSLDYVFKKAGFKTQEIIPYQKYGLDNHLTWLTKGKQGGDKRLTELFGENTEYLRACERIRLTDTLFFIGVL